MYQAHNTHNVQLKQAEVIFHGIVQEVGFRYTTAKLAQRFLVTGWIKNESDGSVKTVIQGEKKEITALINELKSRFSDNITDFSIKWQAFNHKEDSFQIKH